MKEWLTNRSIQRFLQDERAEKDPVYREAHAMDQEERRVMKLTLAFTLAALGFTSLFIAIMYPIAQEQEQYREKFCPTHRAAVECIETPTVPMATPIRIPESNSPTPTVISRR